MGVKDLWQLLSTVGRRVNLETLSGKVLAIDMSIWLTQFIKAMRNEDGTMMKNAHLIGSIRRILKLLFQKIKPVFVFDGDTPALKLNTIRARRKIRNKNVDNVRVSAQQILVSQLKQQALKSKLYGVMKDGSSNNINIDTRFSNNFNPATQSSSLIITDKSNTSLSSSLSSSLSNNNNNINSNISNNMKTDNFHIDSHNMDPNLYNIEWEDDEIRIIPKKIDSDNDEDNKYDDNENRWELPDDIEEIDVDFIASLPTDMRKNLIEAARKKNRIAARGTYLPVVGDMDLYSQTQLANFLKTSTLNKKLNSVQAQVDNREGDIGTRIQSEGGKKYLLINKEIKDIYNSVLDDNDDGICEGLISNQTMKLNRHKMRVINDSDDDDDDDDGGGFITEVNDIIPNHINEINNNPINIASKDYTKWVCSDCTYNNSAILEYCELCDHKRDEIEKSDSLYNQQLKNKSSSSSSSSSNNNNNNNNNSNNNNNNISNDYSLWVCKACTYAQNINNRQNCEVCDYKRDQIIEKIDNKYNKKISKNLTFQEAQEKFLKEKNNDFINIVNDNNSLKNTTNLINIDVRKPIESIDRSDYSSFNLISNNITSMLPSPSHLSINESNSRRISTIISEPSVQVISNFMKDDVDEIDWESDEDNDKQEVDKNNNNINFIDDDNDNDNINDFVSKDYNNLNSGDKSFMTKEFLEDQGDIDDNDNIEKINTNQFYSSSSTSSSNNKGINEDTYQRAITMASNMTEWAGRAVQKVLKEHMNQQSVSNQSASQQFPPSKITNQQFSSKLTETQQSINQSTPIEASSSQLLISQQPSLISSITISSKSSSLPVSQEESNESVSATLMQSSIPATTSSPSLTDIILEIPIVNSIQEKFINNSSIINPISLVIEKVSPILLEQQSAMSTLSPLIKSSSSSITNDLTINVNNSSPIINLKKRLPVTITNDFEEYQNKKKKLEKKNEILDNNVNLKESLLIKENQIIQDTNMLIEEEENETRIRRLHNHSMRDAESLTRDMRDEVIELLNIFNLPYIIAPFEAEAQCAVLEQLGLVDGVVTEDSDVFLFGANTVYKNIFNDKKYVEVYLSKDIKKEIGLEREDLIALAFFLGSDYTEGITGIGIVNAVEIVQTFTMRKENGGPFDGLKQFKKWLDSYTFTDTYNDLINKSKDKKNKKSSKDDDDDDDINEDNNKKDNNEVIILDNESNNESKLNEYKLNHKIQEFDKKHKNGKSKWKINDLNFPNLKVIEAYMQPNVSRNEDKFEFVIPKLHLVRNYCSEIFGWTEQEMDNLIDPVIIKFAERSIQPRIDSHFLQYEDDTKFAKIGSERLKSAVHQITGQTNVISKKLKEIKQILLSNDDEIKTKKNKKKN